VSENVQANPSACVAHGQIAVCQRLFLFLTILLRKAAAMRPARADELHEWASAEQVAVFEAERLYYGT
jgi:hypothetical protein